MRFQMKLIVVTIVVLITAVLLLYYTLRVVDGKKIAESDRPINLDTIEKLRIEGSRISHCSNTGKNEILCFCGYNYMKTKVSFGKIICLPKTCSYIKGYHFIGDIGYGNFESCALASQKNNVSLCNSIPYSQGRDLCILTYVGATNNHAVCNEIENSYLGAACLE